MKELDDTLLAQGLTTLSGFRCGTYSREDVLEVLAGVLVATNNTDVHTLLRKQVTRLDIAMELLRDPACAKDATLREFFGAVAH